MRFETERQLAESVHRLGGILWLVGGAVRDDIRGKGAQDRDYMVTGLPAEALPFERVAGSDFPVFLVRVGGITCEVAMARKEKGKGDGKNRFTCFTDETVSAEADLFRRDLTINAMAKNVLTGEIADPFGGRRDLERRVLRHTSDAFREDPLRVYRVARFAATLGFRVAPDTMRLMAELKPELAGLKAERIWKELEKALACRQPGRFFEILTEAGVADAHFQEVTALSVPDKHDGTAFHHTMRVMNAGSSVLERFGLLVHDFGKGRTPAELHPAHHGHDRLGREAVLTFCERLRIPKAFERFGVVCATQHMRVRQAGEMRHGKFVRWVLSLKPHIDGVVRVSFLDAAHREGADYENEVARFENVLRLIGHVRAVEAEVTGKSLLAEGRQPGKHFGEILFQRRVEAFKARISGRQTGNRPRHSALIDNSL